MVAAPKTAWLNVQWNKSGASISKIRTDQGVMIKGHHKILMCALIEGLLNIVRPYEGYYLLRPSFKAVSKKYLMRKI